MSVVGIILTQRAPLVLESEYCYGVATVMAQQRRGGQHGTKGMAKDRTALVDRLERVCGRRAVGGRRWERPRRPANDRGTY